MSLILTPGGNNEQARAQVAGIQPDMVDKFGTKWYLDRPGSTYASAFGRSGTTLGDGATVWLLEEINGQFKMCLVIDQQVVFEGFSVQQIGHEIDRLRALKLAGRKFK